MIKKILRKHTLQTEDGLGGWTWYGFEITSPFLRGTQHLEPGYIYAPYIPLITNTTISEDYSLPQRTIQSRYGTITVNNNFYNTIDIDGDMLLSR